MEQITELYAPAVWAFGAIAALFLMQMLVADIAGIKAKHIPGAAVAADHGSFLFRATRAHANTNESIAAFILLVLFGVISSAPPVWINSLAWVYVAGRVGHMLFYYANQRNARSISFGVGFIALVGMLISGISAWF